MYCRSNGNCSKIIARAQTEQDEGLDRDHVRKMEKTDMILEISEIDTAGLGD